MRTIVKKKASLLLILFNYFLKSKTNVDISTFV
ncbi:hypothetical protein SGGBAA2069_c12810 [Streptococcus gallolyticus subsp. gallolyticus ATCC BAA-2069]|nr:hypothetical protein SGGBAA2069_c12810 [Streptococcus gallolyticus subsp. gallolyticus ATCC BAA-2069]